MDIYHEKCKTEVVKIGPEGHNKPANSPNPVHWIHSRVKVLQESIKYLSINLLKTIKSVLKISLIIK